jgi:hypothetical protein
VEPVESFAVYAVQASPFSSQLAAHLNVSVLLSNETTCSVFFTTCRPDASAEEEEVTEGVVAVVVAEA